MISYEPLWQTMKRHGATTYTLQAKAGISSSTIRRMQANESVSTNTLDTLCKFFNCELDGIGTCCFSVLFHLIVNANTAL